jgi:hypothetical protein
MMIRSEKIQRVISDALLDESHYSIRNGPLTRQGADKIADRLLLEILELIRD